MSGFTDHKSAADDAAHTDIGANVKALMLERLKKLTERVEKGEVVGMLSLLATSHIDKDGDVKIEVEQTHCGCAEEDMMIALTCTRDNIAITRAFREQSRQAMDFIKRITDVMTPPDQKPDEPKPN